MGQPRGPQQHPMVAIVRAPAAARGAPFRGALVTQGDARAPAPHERSSAPPPSGRGMAKVVRTEIEINATPDRVWSILEEFAAYPEWNPFVRKIEGRPEVGTRLRVLLQAPGGRAMTFKPVVQAADESREFRWLGRLALPGLFSGEHRFRIEPTGDGRVRFHQEETFRGLLVPLMARSLDRDTKAGFEAMNRALKERAEGGAGP